MMQWKRSASGMTLVEVIVVIGCLAAVAGLAGLSLSAINDDHPRVSAKSVRDAAQARQIHTAFVVFAASDRGTYPIPGRMKRLPVEIDGGERQHVPGMGSEDVSQNTTANLYSMMIMSNYFNTDLVISPVERNPKVEKKKDYNYAAYNPTEGALWDTTFVADLTEKSHASYAHMLLHGRRKIEKWRDLMSSQDPILSNRGSKDGKPNPDSYTCDQHGLWSGVIVFGDGHSRLERTVTPDGVTYRTEDGDRKPDNIFAADLGLDGVDAFQTFTLRFRDGKPEIQHD